VYAAEAKAEICLNQPHLSLL